MGSTVKMPERSYIQQVGNAWLFVSTTEKTTDHAIGMPVIFWMHGT